MIAKGYKSVSKKDVLNKVSEAQILAHYFGVYQTDVLINSPLREDKNASMGIYSPNGTDINFIDFGTQERGSIFTLLHRIWNVDYHEVYSRILHDISTNQISAIKTCKTVSHQKIASTKKLDVTIRDWKDYDLEWWGQYGITKKWLDYAEVYPISHIHITKENIKNTFPADKLAYVYIERKEGKITKKIYQPLNTKGYKWCQDNDKSVLGLWTTLPKKGKLVVICSSVKDALTLICNCKIPAICLQGEGYSISETVIKELKYRFEKVFIVLDNDSAGTYDAKKLAKSTGFTNIELPQFEGGKDLADYRKIYGHESFCKIIKSLFNTYFKK